MPDRDYIDISRRISEKTAVWPGDTPFSRRWVMSIADGAACNTSTITLSSHTGTHADAPLHFEEGAAGIDAVELGAYLGPCRVIHTRTRACVTTADLQDVVLERGMRLLLKTPEAPGDEEWKDDFAFISEEVAGALAKARLALVGIDTPSVDPMDSKTMDAHKILLAGGVAILESLDLSSVPEGNYELIALPLKIAGGDSSPVRAVLRPLKGEDEE